MPAVPAEEYERRLAALLQKAGTDWVLVYADREHYANLTYLVNYDPRFEEGLLVLGSNGQRVLIVGNEGMGYLPILTVPVEVELCQTFSLNSQPRSTAPRLKDVLAENRHCLRAVGCVVGWKYLEAYESDDSRPRPSSRPSIWTFCAPWLALAGKLVDGSALMMHPETGLRATNSARPDRRLRVGAPATPLRQCSASCATHARA